MITLSLKRRAMFIGFPRTTLYGVETPYVALVLCRWETFRSLLLVYVWLRLVTGGEGLSFRFQGFVEFFSRLP